MTTHKEYNGWWNYETWLVNLHFDYAFGDDAVHCLEDAVSNASASDDVRDVAIDELSKIIESSVEGLILEHAGSNLLLQDIIGAFTREIEYSEIAAHYINDLPLFCAGWNVPGYMPDNPPALFIDAASARDYLIDAIDNDDAKSALEVSKKGECGINVGNYHYFVARV